MDALANRQLFNWDSNGVRRSAEEIRRIVEKFQSSVCGGPMPGETDDDWCDRVYKREIENAGGEVEEPPDDEDEDKDEDKKPDDEKKPESPETGKPPPEKEDESPPPPRPPDGDGEEEAWDPVKAYLEWLRRERIRTTWILPDGSVWRNGSRVHGEGSVPVR